MTWNMTEQDAAIAAAIVSGIGYSKQNLKIHTGCLPSFPPLPSLSPSPPFLYPLPLEIQLGVWGSSQLRGLGERCTAPAKIDFGAF